MRRPGAVSRDRARAAGGDRATRRASRCSERDGRLPEVVVACVGGGSNRDRRVRRVPRRRGRALGRRRGRPGRGEPRQRAAPAVLHGARSSDPRRRATARSSTRTQSPPASTTRASAPSNRRHAARLRPRRVPPRAPTRRRSIRSPPARADRGHHPGARERRTPWRVRSRPRGGARARVPLGPRRQGPRRGARALTPCEEARRLPWSASSRRPRFLAEAAVRGRRRSRSRNRLPVLRPARGEGPDDPRRRRSAALSRRDAHRRSASSASPRCGPASATRRSFP